MSLMPAKVNFLKHFRHLFVACIALVAASSLAIASGTQKAQAELHPGGNTSDPTILNTDIALPSVVRILTEYSSTLTSRLCANVTDTITATIAFTGSGAFISAHGDILTADHVVDTPTADLDDSTLQVDAQQLATDVAAKCNQTVSPNQIYTDFSADHSLYSVTYAAPQSSVWLDTAYAGPYTQADLRDVTRFPLTTEAHSSYNQNDVAIVHVALTDTPSIPLGTSADLAPSDPLTLIGFPGNGDVSEKPTNFLTQSINYLTLSAIKTNDNGGGTLLQVAGNVEHGDSGGPVINGHGEIVGAVSFSLSDTGDTRFLQASDSVKPLVQQMNLDTTPGMFQTLWHQSMLDYASSASGHWHTAASEMLALQNNYAQFKGLAPYLTYAQGQAQLETIPATHAAMTVNPHYLILGGIGGGFVLILLLILLVTLLQRRNSAKKAKFAAVPMVAPYMPQYPGAMPLPLPAQPTYGPPTSWPPSGTSLPPDRASQPRGPDSGIPPPPMATSWPPQTGWSVPPPPLQQVVAASQWCVNSHAMQPHEVYCSVCGAGRA